MTFKLKTNWLGKETDVRVTETDRDTLRVELADGFVIGEMEESSFAGGFVAMVKGQVMRGNAEKLALEMTAFVEQDVKNMNEKFARAAAMKTKRAEEKAAEAARKEAFE